MIFKRRICDKMSIRKINSKGSKALFIEGARRIGKSTIAEEFTQKEYKSYIIIVYIPAYMTMCL